MTVIGPTKTSHRRRPVRDRHRAADTDRGGRLPLIGQFAAAVVSGAVRALVAWLLDA
ncbi:hypothetical protein [Streptomyces sp. XD-27]|uniref:hypothetical protein n=1 Tax=Streptomyces sp. XD-27 TaxID=3062779 RepID=UPI0026F420DA|nr:hypothetical protein [Streptomyces sp. XD-27]WKX69081.1 hypothetical protein Q3Y56_03375 [Streptomyces sp. XD-27]